MFVLSIIYSVGKWRGPVGQPKNEGFHSPQRVGNQKIRNTHLTVFVVVVVVEDNIVSSF